MHHRVVLIHGIFNTGYVFYALRKQLEGQGMECYTPNLKPIDGRHGMDDWAIKLKQKIDNRFGENSPITLIGFSMGGIVSRYYIQKLAGYKRVDLFFTISSPHHGSYLAYLYPGKGTKQLRPNSEFLKKLQFDIDKYHQIQVYSYWTPFDLMIIPATSSIWSIAENKRFYSLFHLLMLFNRQLNKDINNIILRQPEIKYEH